MLKYIHLFVGMLCCCIVSAQTTRNVVTITTSQEARQYYEQGNQLFQAKNYGSAKEKYFHALKADSSFTAVMDQLADVYRIEENLDSTIFYYQKSLDIYPRNLAAHQELAAAYQIQGDFQGAIRQYQSLLDHYPGYPEAYYGLGRVYFNLEEYYKAIKFSEYAMQTYLAGGKYVQAAESRMLAGRAYLNLDEDQRAIKYFKASKKHFQDKAYYHYYLGLAHLKLDKKKDAEEYLTKAEDMGYQVPSYIKSRLNDEFND